MTRPARGTDLRLLRAGRRLLPRAGAGRLRLRQVAAAAKVNLGMFHYHFGTKRRFLRRVLDEACAEMGRDPRLEPAQAAAPERRLRAELLALARLVRDRRQVLAPLLRDTLDGDPEVLRLAKTALPRRAEELARLVRDCQSRGALRKEPVCAAVAFLVAGAVLPGLGAALLERVAAGRPAARLRALLLSERALAARVEAALRGLRPKP